MMQSVSKRSDNFSTFKLSLLLRALGSAFMVCSVSDTSGHPGNGSTVDGTVVTYPKFAALRGCGNRGTSLSGECLRAGDEALAEVPAKRWQRAWD
jgi:hypothetical protein